MLEKCKENCIETEDASGGMIEKTLFNSNTEVISSEYVLLGEDMNLCSIDVKSTDSIKKIISAFDKVLCTIKDKAIDSVYNDIDVSGSCITKTLNINSVTGNKTIKLTIDSACIKSAIGVLPTTSDPSPFIIHADKYSICGIQTTTLISDYPDTAWYNQQGIVIGSGTTKVVLSGGNYYAVRQGKISNVVNIIYKAVCNVYSYTKVKSFYKTCPTGTTSNSYTYTKVYTSETSYQDALNKSELDSNTFNQEGQYTVDATGICFGVQVPPDTSCFNVFLSNVISGTSVPVTPVITCNLFLSVSNITCVTPLIPSSVPSVAVESVPSTPVTNTNINVFVFAGESNAGTRNNASTLSVGEGGLRAGVKIWNNSTNKLEQLNIGVNNYQGEIAAEIGGWGWELQLANLRGSGTIKDDFIIVKTAQGGARIGNYNSNITDQVPNNFDMMVTRINGVKAALQLLGKTPVFNIMYSQGINNALAPALDDQLNFPNVTGIAYWKAATKVYSDKLRIATGTNAKISYMKFPSPYGDYLNTTIQQIADENPLNSVIVTQGLGLQPDGLHFDASATKSIVDKYITSLAINIATPQATPVAPSTVGVDSIPTTTNAITNTLVDMSLSAETMWNRFQPDLIPDFTPPTSYDVKTGQTLPNKWFIWQSPYKNLFGSTEYERLSKMIKKGITAFAVSKLPATPFSSEIQALITPERIVGEARGISGYNTAEEVSYTTFAKWASDGVRDVLQYGASNINGKYNQFLTHTDYEGSYSAIASQIPANYNSVALNAQANIARGRVAFMYAAALTSQGLYTSILYNGSNNLWASGADSTVPAEFVGKSMASNNKITGVIEITNALESILPEGYQVQDQNNNNWFTIKHFGKELDNTYSGGQLDQCNAQHWATNVGVGTETAYAVHKSYGQDLIIQLKNNNETDNGFHYDQRYAQFRNNKYASYVSRYGILNVRDIYVNGIKGTEEFIMPMGTENITNFMAEGQTMLAYFCGAKGINLWNSDFNDVAIPKPKEGNPRQGAKYNDVNFGNRDLESYNYMLKALWRLNQKVLLSNGLSYSFNEICDGTEIYLNQSTKVVYPGSSTVTQLRALDWQILQKSCVRAVVNTSKNVVFVIAFQAYGVEQNQVTFKLTDYGANISQVIDIPAGKIIVKAYPLTGIIAPTILVVDSVPSPVTIPVVDSIPTPVYTPIATSNVTITQPSRVANYYKSLSGNTEVISNYVLNTDDNVYIQNDKIKVGFSLRGGGAITYMSVANSTLNIINNHDMGRQIQPDYYQSPNTFSVAGKQTSTNFPNNGYNTTLGGDDFKNSVTLKEYYPITNGYYVKLNPLIWGINGAVSEITTEITYLLTGSTLKTTYKYTSNRTDSQIVTTNPNIVGQSIPAIYLNKFFTVIKTYDGTSPYIGSPISDKTISSTAINVASTVFTTFNATEKWTAISAPAQNLILGVYSNKLDYVRAERKNIINEDYIGDTENACTLVEITDSPVLPDSHNSWTRSDDVYYTLDTIDVIRTKAYQLSGSTQSPVVTPVVVPVTPVVTPTVTPIVSTTNNITNAIDCNTKNLTITGNFIAGNNFGMSLVTQGGINVSSKDNLSSGNFNQVFINVTNGNYFIKLFEIGKDSNYFNSPIFSVSCATTPVAVVAVENTPSPITTVPTTNSAGAERVLILGNSIVDHPAVASIGWAGNWGMAASADNKTFVSLVRAYYQGLNSSNIVTGYNIANTFEQGYLTLNVAGDSYLNSIKENNTWTTIIIRLGENINADNTYNSDVLKQKLADLISLMSGGRTVKVIISNCFWTSSQKDLTFSQFATTNNYKFANLTGLYSYQGVNTAWNTVNNAVLSTAIDGVKNHPGDLGMAEIANKIINAITGNISVLAPVAPVTVGGVTITVPNKPQYYFSNNQSPSYYASSRLNLPAIFTNNAEFDPINDIVYLENANVRYGINLKRGGQLCYASIIGTNNNLIYNGHDGGFQVCLDATQILSAPYILQGKTCQNPENNDAYNTTMGGSYKNQSQTLMDYHTVGTNGYYVKFRPIMYAFDAVISEAEIEVTYTLLDRSLKIDYKYTSFRTDGQYPINPVAPQGLKGWAIPISFLVEKLNRYQVYTGTSPFNINSPVEDGMIPNTTPNQGGATIIGRDANEFWGLSYNQSENVGFGSYNISEGGTHANVRWEQRQKYAGNPAGNVFTGGFTVMDLYTSILVPDGGNYTKSTTAYVAVGTPLQIRQSFFSNTAI